MSDTCSEDVRTYIRYISGHTPNTCQTAIKHRVSTPVQENSNIYFSAMKTETDNLYHVYNRGNQKQVIYYNDNHYNLFLGKVEKYIVPCADILSWTLMPNHYHFLIYANEKSVELINNRNLPISRLSEGFRLLQSSYTKALNAERDLWGNLFHQKFQSKLMRLDSKVQSVNTFHYIHGNACKAGLVEHPEDWPYSSLNEYLDPSRAGICNQKLAMQLLEIDIKDIRLGVRAIAAIGN